MNTYDRLRLKTFKHLNRVDKETKIIEVEPKIYAYKCCVCQKEVIRDGREWLNMGWKMVALPINEKGEVAILCHKCFKYVNLIMDVFQYIRGKCDWAQASIWKEWIKENKWILDSKLR